MDQWWTCCVLVTPNAALEWQAELSKRKLGTCGGLSTRRACYAESAGVLGALNMIQKTNLR